jgi:lysophospholipase L1-like esterase
MRAWIAAWASLAMFAAYCVQPAQGSVTAPQRSLRWLDGRQVWVPLCARRGVNGSAAWFDNTNTAVMDQQACISPSWGTVTAVKLVFAAFDMPQQGEVDRPVTATGTAAIFVPSLNTNVLTSGSGVAAGSFVINPFPSTLQSANGVSLGQFVSATSTGGVAGGAYVTGIANSFTAGSGNVPGSTSVTLSAATTAATTAGEKFTFSGLFTPVKFGGKRSFTIEPAHDVVTSDPVAVTLAPSTWFLVRTSATMSGTGLQLADMPGTARLTVTSNGSSFQEFDSRGTAVNDQTMTPLQVANTGGGYWGPVAVLALVTPNAGAVPPGAVLILGDSIAAGTGDAADALGLEGYIQRSLENNVPFISAARGSTTAAGLLAHGDGQYALSIDTGITDVILEPGRNDIEILLSGASALKSTITAVAARYAGAGRRAWCVTVVPSTYSNDGWMTAANQSFPAATSATGTAATASGAVQIALTSIANLTTGMSVGLNLSTAGAIAPGTTVTAINGGASTITISAATTASIAAGTTLYFGAATASGSAVETQRQSYNALLRTGWASMGCSGLIDIDGVVSDPVNIGKWRTDLGQASIDGVHPSAVLHQQAVNAGILAAAMFAVP